MVRALYIDNDTCLGYWYIECDKSMVQDEQTTFSSTLGGLRPRRATGDKENMAGGNANLRSLHKIVLNIPINIVPAIAVM